MAISGTKMDELGKASIISNVGNKILHNLPIDTKPMFCSNTWLKFEFKVWAPV